MVPSDLTTTKLGAFLTEPKQYSKTNLKKKNWNENEKRKKNNEPEKDLRGEKRKFLESKELDGNDDNPAAAPTPWKMAAIGFALAAAKVKKKMKFIKKLENIFKQEEWNL